MSVSLRALFVLICCCLLQTHHCSGQSVVGSSDPVVASVGDDVVLPCLFRPLRDVSALTLEWTRPDLEPRFVFVWRSYEELLVLKNPAFIERATLFTDELKHGNISLKLAKVRISDAGGYRCFVPGLGIETSVVLQVVVPGSPALVSVSAVHRWSSKVELQCVSEAWYPQPELQWLDSEGRLLSAEHTLPLPAPDGLYSISSRLTVEHSGSFTCRLSHRSTNTTSQDTVRLTGDLFGVHVWILPVVIALAAAATVSVGLAIILSFLCCRRQAHKTTEDQEDSSKMRISELEEKIKSLESELDSSKSRIAELEKNEPDDWKTKCESIQNLNEKRREKELSESKSVLISHFDPWGRSFSLKNNSSETLKTLLWEVHIEVGDNKPLIYKFKTGTTLRTGDSVSVWAEGWTPVNMTFRDEVWEKQPPWNTGETALVCLYNMSKELLHVIIVKMFLDQPPGAAEPQQN